MQVLSTAMRSPREDRRPERSVRYSRSGMKNEWAAAMCETFSSMDVKAGTEQKRHCEGEMRDRREAIRSSMDRGSDVSSSPSGCCSSGAGCVGGSTGADGVSGAPALGSAGSSV